MTVSQMTTHRRKQTLYYGAILVVYLFWPSGQRQGKTSPQQRWAENPNAYTSMHGDKLRKKERQRKTSKSWEPSKVRAEITTW